MPPIGERPGRSEGLKATENISGPTHRVKARRPEGLFNIRSFTVIKEPQAIKRTGVLTDEAHFPGGNSLRVYSLTGDTSEADISHIIQETAQEGWGIVVRGGGTSITGAVVPMGEAVIDMSNRKKIKERGKNAKGEETITVQPGLLIKDLQARLSVEGLFLPAAPTEENASVGGAVNTNAAGARSEKYGKMREYVDGIKLGLASGDVLDINRGDYLAHPPDEEHPYNYYFELESADGKEVRTILVPNFERPDLTKTSLGYLSMPVNDSRSGEDVPTEFDLIDLIVGSEGTLGVIEEVRLKVIKEPPTAIVRIPCKNDQEMFKLMRKLSEQEDATRGSREPGGISAIEYIGEDAVKILREHGPNKNVPAGNAFVIAQVELPDGDDTSLMELGAVCEESEISDITVAMPYDKALKREFINMREDVPRTVNLLVGMLGVTKAGADPCVRPTQLEDAVNIYKEEAAIRGLIAVHWGHGGDGNPHPNIISENVALAREVVIKGGERVIDELGGSAGAEHGTGKKPDKKDLLAKKVKSTGIAQMRAVKKAFDPDGRMAPGNIFDLAA